jgi:hypothetical protein
MKVGIVTGLALIALLHAAAAPAADRSGSAGSLTIGASPAEMLRSAPPPIIEPLSFSAPQFELFDMSANFFESSQVVVINGKVRNLGQSPARGHVIVYFRSAGDDILYTAEVDVNGRSPFPHGVAVPFETTAGLGGAVDIRKVTVEFVAD